MLGQFCLCSAGFHGLDAMDDEAMTVQVSEALKMSFEVGLGRLAFVANRHGVVLVEVSWGASLEQVGTGLVDAAS